MALSIVVFAMVNHFYKVILFPTFFYKDIFPVISRETSPSTQASATSIPLFAQTIYNDSLQSNCTQHHAGISERSRTSSPISSLLAAETFSGQPLNGYRFFRPGKV